MGCPFCKVFHNKSEEWCRQTRKGVQVGISDPNGADCARIAFNLSRSHSVNPIVSALLVNTGNINT